MLLLWKEKLPLLFLLESIFHHSPCFPKLMETVSKKSHSPLGSDWWITFEMNKWTIFKKAIRLWWWNEGIIAVMKWRRQDHLVNKAGHCNHVEDGHHFGVLQQKWFYLSTDENCWAKTPGDADKSGSLKTWRRSQLFWSSTASTGKLLWPLKRRTHLRISIELFQLP